MLRSKEHFAKFGAESLLKVFAVLLLILFAALVCMFALY